MSGKIQYWRYEIPSINGEGWGIFLLDSTGFFSCVTDYGNYAFRWTHHGMDDFRKFFDRGSYEYILKKLHLGCGKKQEMDAEETLNGIIKYILSSRRDGSMDEDFARLEYDHAWSCYNDYGDGMFDPWYLGTEIDDAQEYICTGYSPDDKALMNILLPRLTEAIQKDLESAKDSV